MKRVSRTIEDVPTYGFHLWHTLVMKVIRNEGEEDSSKKTSEQYRMKAEAQGGDDMEIVEVRLTDTADAVPV